MKWEFDHLLTEWKALVKACQSLDEFRPLRDTLIAESGWTKEEFYLQIDKAELASWRKHYKEQK